MDDQDHEHERAVLEAALSELSGGPLSLTELTARLSHNGVFAHLDGLDDEELAEELDEILLDTDATWLSQDGIVALTSTLLDGAVFSHWVTGSELARGVLDSTPDLCALDFDDDDGLDLPDDGKITCKFAFEGEAALDDNGSFVGPPGWLSFLQGPGWVGVRRTGKKVVLEPLAELGNGDSEVTALRAAFDLRYADRTGIESWELVLDALSQDPALWRSPVAPISELLARGGLELRGAWVGSAGEDWEPPGKRYLERETAARNESWGFSACCEKAFVTVQEAWEDHVLSRGGTVAMEPRAVARALAHGSVAPAFAEYVLEEHNHGSDHLVSFATQLSGLPGKLAAPGLYLRALDAERDGRAPAAEVDLHSAVLADPEFGPALSEYAWYLADRGDARQAASLLRRADMLSENQDDPELAYLETRLQATQVRAGRNDPCPCGSGRKFKACCIDNRTTPIEARAGWLHHKIVTFGLRPGRRLRVEQLVEATGHDLRSPALPGMFPLLVDIAAFDDGAVSDFVEQRGFLLPPDERELAGSWVDSQLGLFEVDEVARGHSVTLRDTRTSERVVVTERLASQSLRQGEFVLARVVRAGSQSQIVGAPLQIELRHRGSLVEVLDADPDGEDLAAWLGLVFAPPRLTNREGEDLMLCRAVLRPRTTPWDDVVGSLEACFGEGHEGVWTETVTLDGEEIVRGFIRREDDRLILETNSVARYQRLLATLGETLAIDFETLDEEMVPPLDAVARQGGEGIESGVLDMDAAAPELQEALQAFLREKEEAWLHDHVPALGGLTPLEAADDPTRREDLLALLNEFEDREDDLSPPMASFDVARLRRLLDLPADPP